MSNQYKFDGYDWTELSNLWGISPNIRGYKGRLDATAEFMGNCLSSRYTANVAGEQLRGFLKALIRREEKIRNYEDARVWKALTSIESNEKLLLYCRGLLEHMWT